MPLTDTSIRLARARDRAYKLADAHGLWLFIQPNGRKWWRFRYRFQGVEKMLSFGTYPEIPLTEARDRREEARRQLATGINPSAERKAEKAAAMNTFETVARHWLTGLARHVRKKKSDRSPPTRKRNGCWKATSFQISGTSQSAISRR